MKMHLALVLGLLVAAGCQDNDKSADKSRKSGGDTRLTAKGSDLSAADKQFVLSAASGGNFEVLSSELALTKPVDQKTKTFAQRMIKDHTAVNNELMALAGRKDVTVPTKLMAKHQQMLDDLRKASNDEFQSKYTQHQMAAHDEAIALFQTTSQSATAPDVKAFAAKHLPALKEHKQMMGH